MYIVNISYLLFPRKLNLTYRYFQVEETTGTHQVKHSKLCQHDYVFMRSIGASKTNTTTTNQCKSIFVLLRQSFNAIFLKNIMFRRKNWTHLAMSRAGLMIGEKYMKGPWILLLLPIVNFGVWGSRFDQWSVSLYRRGNRIHHCKNSPPL